MTLMIWLGGTAARPTLKITREEQMNIPGYDDWRLSGPPEPIGPTCDCCGSGEDIRVDQSGKKPQLICEECFGGFDDLQTASEYAQEQADLRADYLHDQQRDRKGEER